MMRKTGVVASKNRLKLKNFFSLLRTTLAEELVGKQWRCLSYQLMCGHARMERCALRGCSSHEQIIVINELTDITH